MPGISHALFCLIFLRTLQESDIIGQMRDWKLRKIKKYNKVTKAAGGGAGIPSLGLLAPDHNVWCWAMCGALLYSCLKGLLYTRNVGRVAGASVDA